ncbi:MAG: sulfatase-like hydrolase/transferase, partial [Verrucomicrobiota bacterium]
MQRIVYSLLRLWLLLLFLTSVLLADANLTRPNIIFILTDDLGYGDLGVLFQNGRKLANNRSKPWELTPKLDRFAAEGVQLRSHYCAAPVCAPSRASILLGVSQGHARVRDNQFDKALE